MNVPTPSYQSSPALGFPVPRKRTVTGFEGMGQDETGWVVIDPDTGLLVPAMPPAPTIPAPATPTVGSSWWENLLKTGEQVLLQKTQTRGVYTQTMPGGQTITYVQPAGQQPSIVSGVVGGVQAGATATPGVGLILVGGAALLLVIMMARR